MDASRIPVIAAIGATAFSKNAGRSETLLGIEAVSRCLEEAGLPPGEVDGTSTFTMDMAPEIELQAGCGLGELHFMSRLPLGGRGACATIMMAAMAVQTGVAHSVVAYRALRTSSGGRFGAAAVHIQPECGDFGWFTDLGLVTPGSRAAIMATEYLDRYGLGPDAFAPVGLNARHYAATNPAAYYYRRPMTFADYQASPMVSSPLRKADFCQESDGAVALLVTSLERARDLKQTPIHIRAAAQSQGIGRGQVYSLWNDDPLKLAEAPGLKAQLEARSGMSLQSVDGAMIYDNFANLVLLQLEQLGFCGDGEGPGFVSSGATRLGGSLPLNTNGGHIGEAYMHGMNGILEAVRQLRGDAANQIVDPTNILVTSAVAASGLILGRD